MAKTKAKPDRARPVGIVPVRLDLGEADRDRLRIQAATAGLSMASYVRAIVEVALDNPRTIDVARKHHAEKKS